MINYSRVVSHVSFFVLLFLCSQVRMTIEDRLLGLSFIVTYYDEFWTQCLVTIKHSNLPFNTNKRTMGSCVLEGLTLNWRSLGICLTISNPEDHHTPVDQRIVIVLVKAEIVDCVVSKALSGSTCCWMGGSAVGLLSVLLERRDKTLMDLINNFSSPSLFLSRTSSFLFPSVASFVF